MIDSIMLCSWDKEELDLVVYKDKEQEWIMKHLKHFSLESLPGHRRKRRTNNNYNLLKTDEVGHRVDCKKKRSLPNIPSCIDYSEDGIARWSEHCHYKMWSAALPSYLLLI